ncbi:MAG TPA: hypothetical protein VE869_11795 [Gemmatimonas sp.]|nr:hypothetical protein [Gemmatimonas sp.]
MHSTSDSSLLVSLNGLHETIAAGYGSAMAYVRTLDDVSFSLRERDLVLLGDELGFRLATRKHLDRRALSFARHAGSHGRGRVR